MSVWMLNVRLLRLVGTLTIFMVGTAGVGSREEHQATPKSLSPALAQLTLHPGQESTSIPSLLPFPSLFCPSCLPGFGAQEEVEGTRSPILGLTSQTKLPRRLGGGKE